MERVFKRGCQWPFKNTSLEEKHFNGRLQTHVLLAAALRFFWCSWVKRGQSLTSPSEEAAILMELTLQTRIAIFPFRLLATRYFDSLSLPLKPKTSLGGRNVSALRRRLQHALPKKVYFRASEVSLYSRLFVRWCFKLHLLSKVILKTHSSPAQIQLRSLGYFIWYRSRWRLWKLKAIRSCNQ